MLSQSLDLGCGPNPKNPYHADLVYGIDIRSTDNSNIVAADLCVEPIPFEDNYFDYVTAYDFIEHIPRIVYCPKRRFAFVELMNEIYRVLKPAGIFYSSTPAYPAPQVFRDPTHVNIITEETFPMYFDNHTRWASMYGFYGSFEILSQYWHENQIYLITEMRKTS